MGGYIGATAVGLTTTAADVQGDITSTDTTPELILKNTSEEDTEGGREGKITFKGEQSGGEETTLAQIQASHDGTSDDEKGDLIFKTNDGSDGASPTEAMRIDSAQNVGIGTSSPSQKLHVSSSSGIVGLLESTGSSAARLYFDNTGMTTAGDTQVWAQNNDLAFNTNGSERMRILNDGKVGIGTSTPTGNTNASAVVLEVNSTGANPPEILAGGQNAEISIAGGSGASYLWSTGAYPLVIATNATERMRIDNSGNVLVSATTTSGFQSSSSESGSIIYAAGSIASNSPSNDVAAVFNRLGTDGTIVQLKKDGSTVGQLQSDVGSLVLTAASDVRIINANGDGFRTGTASGALALICLNSSADSDGQGDIGLSSLRWNDIFATNGTIQTSDEREKQQIASLTNAEITAATAISKLFKTYKWNDSVAENGDNARTHTGVVAQQVEQAMTDAGLDASKYAFWCSDTWWETQTEVAAVEADEENGIEAKDSYTRTDHYWVAEDAPEGATERNRKGIRYPELLSFIGAATEQRLTSIEARLDALEG